MPQFKIKMPMQEPEKPVLSPPGRRRRILRNVALTHAAILLLPLGILSVADWLYRKPKEETIKITIAEATPRRAGDPKLRPAPPQDKPRPKPAPAPPKLIKPAPLPPKPVQAKPEPKIDNTRLARTQPKTLPTQNKPPPRQQQQRNDDLKPVTQLPDNPAVENNNDNDSQAGYATYDENLAATLYELWKPPSGALLNGRRVEVLVRITVNAAGKILRREIMKNSGFAPMDESVRKLLDSLSDLPEPPEGRLVFEISFVPLEQ